MTQSEALQILKTGANVFLTGEPGSGKTHTINEYVSYLRACGIEPAITASTGIAATHIGGMTIHSWSGIGIKSNIDQYDIDRISSLEYIARRISKTSVLIIDEVSMLPPETLAAVDAVCRAIKQRGDSFGGMQVILVGDFFQLPPIKSLEPKDKLSTKQQSLDFYSDDLEEAISVGVFAFSSPAWEHANPIVCYLSEQYRQDDDAYLSILSAIRTNSFDQEHLDHLQTRKVLPHAGPKEAPRLFSHNVSVDALNDATLAKIDSDERVFEMESTGPAALVSSLIKGCLSPELLRLKVGASVMFTKNNPKEEFVNGTLGEVTGFDTTSGYPLVKTRNGAIVEAKPMDWSVEEGGKIRASITQIPLRLAWAITVHKSQGMSLDEAVMDLSRVFEYGQGYVALSRVRRLSGLYIIGWNRRAFEVHPEIIEKDNVFRTVSKQAQSTFGKMESIELSTLHRNFITACGGRPSLKLRRAKGSASTESQRGKGKLAKLRETHPNAYRPWSTQEDQELKELFLENITPAELSKKFGRKRGAINSRLLKLGLLEE